MSKKMIVKLICVVLMLIYCCIVLPNTASAADWSYGTAISDTWTTSIDSGVQQTTKNIMSTAVNVIRIVGTGVAIIMITYVAIKYMSAAPQEKAEFKKSAVAMIVGAIVLFGATNIIGLISNFATTNVK